MELIRKGVPVGDLPAEITRFVVRTFASGLGRGPAHARSYVSDDLATVLLRETLTKPERLLLEHGHRTEVAASRAAIQRVLGRSLTAGVELATGKRVTSLHIDHQIEPDIVAINFVFTVPTRNEPGAVTIRQDG